MAEDEEGVDSGQPVWREDLKTFQNDTATIGLMRFEEGVVRFSKSVQAGVPRVCNADRYSRVQSSVQK